MAWQEGTILGWREIGKQPVRHQLVRVYIDNLDRTPIPLPWVRSVVP